MTTSNASPTTTTTTISEQLAETMKRDIIALATDGTVSTGTRSINDLQVDINCLGDTEALFDLLVTESGTDEAHQCKLDAFMAIRDPALVIVYAWLKAGGLLDDLRQADEEQREASRDHDDDVDEYYARAW